MRYFPIGRRLSSAVSLNDIEFHPGSTILSRRPPSMITEAGRWHYAAFLPLRVRGDSHHFIEVNLSVARGRVGVALQRADETIVEQQPVPDHWSRCKARFFMEPSKDGCHLLFRNWGDTEQPAEFTIEEVTVKEAFRHLSSDQHQELGPQHWISLDRTWPKYLEFHILDYCNQNCPFCSHGTPLETRGRWRISLADLKRYSELVEPYEFDGLKISGGEPTLHPEFREICLCLRELFPARRYDLATNGARLAHFLDCIDVFDWIDLSNYPGKNDEIFSHLTSLNIPNVFPYSKRTKIEYYDFSQNRNSDKVHIFENCPLQPAKLVVKDRIYKCPTTYSQIIPPHNIPIESVSVPFDQSWRRNLAALDTEFQCRRCFVPIDAPTVSQNGAQGKPSCPPDKSVFFPCFDPVEFWSGVAKY